VRLEELSFREAHEIAAEVSRSVVSIGGDIGTDGYDAFQNAFKRCTGRDSSVEPEKFAEIVSPENFVRVRDRFGGPAPEAMAQALSGYREEISRIRSRMTAAREREAASARDLHSRFTALLGAR